MLSQDRQTQDFKELVANLVGTMGGMTYGINY